MADESTIRRYRKRTPILDALHYTGGFPLEFLLPGEELSAGDHGLNGDCRIRSDTDSVYIELGYVLLREENGGLTTYPTLAQFEAEFEEAQDATG